MIFTRYADGSVTVDHFAAETTASLELLAAADPTLLRVEWEGVAVHILGVRYVVSGVDYANGIAQLRKDALP